MIPGRVKSESNSDQRENMFPEMRKEKQPPKI
jgi:hypothetical protein